LPTGVVRRLFKALFELLDVAEYDYPIATSSGANRFDDAELDDNRLGETRLRELLRTATDAAPAPVTRALMP
jgi:hypothetical protein